MPGGFVRRGLTAFTLTALSFIILYFSYGRDDRVTAPAIKRNWNCPVARSGEARKSVAVIGAGSAGASAAYYLKEFGDQCFDISIDVFERNDYIGGRSTTVPVFNDPSHPVELGASIFVEVNHNLVSVANRLGLKSKSPITAVNTDADLLGVWDGESFVFVQPANESSWKSLLKLFWKYGLSPMRTQRLMKSTVGMFLKLYEAPYFPFASLTDVARAVGLTPATSQPGSNYLTANKIQPPFSTDLIQASTRVNYAQNLDQIHGLETMVCMATDGAMAIQGGNFQIFEGMLFTARAAVHINTSVTSVSKNDDGTYKVTAASASGDSGVMSADFDEVVIAAPYQYTNISLPEGLSQTPEKIDYVSLHVTLFATPHTLQPQYFNLSAPDQVPGTVLTTLPDHAVSGGGVDGPRDFFSISTLDEVLNPATFQNEYVYKIFSSQPVSDSLLQELFLGVVVNPGKPEDGDGVTTWKHEKIWNSYPYLPPRVTFEGPILDDGLWYTAGIESFISTMETSSLMGMNVAGLIMQKWTTNLQSEVSYGGEEL